MNLTNFFVELKRRNVYKVAIAYGEQRGWSCRSRARFSRFSRFRIGLRVNVQLINARNGSQLWGKKYDCQLTDIFALESEIASMLVKRSTGDPDAYELYLKGPQA